jgi:hypothetical protein
MMLSILTFIHLAFALMAIGSGAIVLFGLLTVGVAARCVRGLQR